MTKTFHEGVTEGDTNAITFIMGAVPGDVLLTDDFGLENGKSEEHLKAAMCEFAKARSKAGAKPTYLYYFTHVMPGAGSDQGRRK